MKKQIRKLLDAQFITLSEEYLTDDTYVLVFRSAGENGWEIIDDYELSSIRGRFYRLLM